MEKESFDDEDMNKELNEDDLNLLQRYFGKKMHLTIQNHKATPPNVLKLLAAKPRHLIKLLSPTNVSLTAVIITFLFALLTNYLTTGQLLAIPNIQTDLRLPLLLFVIVTFGILAYWITINTLSSLKQVENEWLLFEFMQILHQDNEESKSLRLFLENPPVHEPSSLGRTIKVTIFDRFGKRTRRQ